MSVLNKTVSYYPSTTATTRGQEVNLLKLLQSNKHKERIVNLRASEKEVQKQLKEILPCYTPAGRFNRRCEEGLIELSGLAAVDLDSVEQYDQLYILKHLRQDLPCIAHAGFSCRGQRLYCLVVLKFPDQYQRHYARLIQSFEEYNLPMGDQCHKSISQPRFVTWNDEEHQFFVHDPEPYELLAAEKKFYQIRIPKQNIIRSSSPEGEDVRRTGEDAAEVFAWCVEQINKKHSFIENQRHEYIKQLARYCNMKGIPEQDTLNSCLSFVEGDFDAEEIEKLVRYIYLKQADSHNTYPFRSKGRKQKVKIESQSEVVADEMPSQEIVAGIKQEKISNSKQKNWSNQIAELKIFFESCSLPTQPIQLNGCSTIKDVSAFVQSHLAMVKAHNGEPIFEPFLIRLCDLKDQLMLKNIS